MSTEAVANLPLANRIGANDVGVGTSDEQLRDVEARGLTDPRQDLPEARGLPLRTGVAAEGTLTGKERDDVVTKEERGRTMSIWGAGSTFGIARLEAREEMFPLASRLSPSLLKSRNAAMLNIKIDNPIIIRY